MGFSVSGSTVVIFIGVLLTLSVAYPTLDNSYDQIREAQDGKFDREVQTANTKIKIADTTYQDGPGRFTVVVENTGATTLNTTKMDILLDGVIQDKSQIDVRVDGDQTRVYAPPGTTIELEINGVNTKPGRLKVVTEYEIAEFTEVT